MSLLEQQVAQIRREMELLKRNQVVIYDSEPKSPTTQSIWRDGPVVKIWDRKNWRTTGGGISDFSMNVEFTADDFDTVSWSSGVLNVSKPDGTATFSISPGSFNLTTTTYFYWQEDIPNAIQTTTDSFTAVSTGGLLLATGYPNADISGKAVLNIFGGAGTDQYITAVNIADGAVTAAKTNLAAISAITGNLNTGTVGTAQIVDNAVNSLKILDGAISSSKIALLAITSGLIAANAVTETKIANDSITSPKILAGAIVAGKIAANAVTANEIAAGSITTGKIAAGAVTANEIAAGAIVAGKIAAGAIVAGDISAGAITTAKLAAGAVTANEIAAGTITASRIATGTITANEIAGSTITANKLATALLYAGAITLDTNGLIKGGQTAFNTGTGFFLGYSGSAYKFSIGNSAANYFTYDGTNMVVNGGTIRTGTTGQRIEISGNTFRSYDSANVLRVQTAEAGMRVTDSTGVYSSDLSAGVYDNGSGIIWPYMNVHDSSTPTNRVGLRTAFISGTINSVSLDLYLRGGTISFKAINNAGGTGVRITSPDDDTLAFTGTKISFNGIILEKIGSDLYWNGVKIN